MSPSELNVALIDYGAGNIRSVHNALIHSGANVTLTDDPAIIEKAHAIVLPGVGAFGDCARALESRGLMPTLKTWTASDKPFLGICVGFQLLFESSEESPGVDGIGFLRGRVRKFNTPNIKVPQIGWNKLTLSNPAHPLWKELPQEPFVYFVHSFFPEPSMPSDITASACYGEPFTAAAGRGNVHGMQYHPEKSQTIGLQMLRNFLSITREYHAPHTT